MIFAIMGCSGTGKSVITNFLVNKFNFKIPLHMIVKSVIIVYVPFVFAIFIRLKLT